MVGTETSEMEKDRDDSKNKTRRFRASEGEKPLAQTLLRSHLIRHEGTQSIGVEGALSGDTQTF